MVKPYYFGVKLEPVKENILLVAKKQLDRNFAQTFMSVYELTDDQAAEIYTAGVGSGTAYSGNWVPARCVFINGEAVLRLKFRGTDVLTCLPYTSTSS